MKLGIKLLSAFQLIFKQKFKAVGSLNRFVQNNTVIIVNPDQRLRHFFKLANYFDLCDKCVKTASLNLAIKIVC